MLYSSTAALSWREPGLEDRGSGDRKGSFPKEQFAPGRLEDKVLWSAPMHKSQEQLCVPVTPVLGARDRRIPKASPLKKLEAPGSVRELVSKG